MTKKELCLQLAKIQVNNWVKSGHCEEKDRNKNVILQSKSHHILSKKQLSTLIGNITVL